MTTDPRDRGGAKWDRAARYLKIAMILRDHPDGLSAEALAQRVGVAKRTIYRDIESMDLDAGLPIWNDKGRFGLEREAFLQPLALTLHEATTLFLAARMLAKASDEHDTELIGAFVKLAQILPPVLAEHIQETVDAFSTATERNENFTRVFRVLAEAWAQRRVVEIEYDSGVYDPSKGARKTRVQPLAIEPSALTHALYLMGWDESRRASRTFKVERILSASLTPDSFEPVAGATTARDLLRAWDVIADEDPVSVVIRFSTAVAKRAAETRWHPSQELERQSDGTLIWRGLVSGMREIRIWILGWGAEAEVLEPLELRTEIAAETERAAVLYRDY
ncbi:MAG: helix-turn-helix transcriptional regulator [Candidatus Limnocylindrales bacterium]